MHAIVLVRHGNAQRAFAFYEKSDPEPGAGEVRIAVELSGLNFADVLARKGLYQAAPPLPCILGFDVVGCIDKVGEGVIGLSEGMRVVAMSRFGGYASKVIARTYGVVEIPNNMNSDAACALGTQYATAWYAAMELVRLHAGDRVLIHSAAGGVGTALVQLAKFSGCTVVGTTRSRDKFQYLASIGVDFPVFATDGDVCDEFRRISHGQGADVIFDSLGGVSVRRGITLLTSGGRIVSYGVSSMCGERMQLLRCARTMLSFGMVNPISLLLHSRGVIGVNLLQIADDRPDIIQRCMQSVVNLVKQGSIQPIAGKVFPHGEVAAAHEMLESGKSVGKLALRWKEVAPHFRKCEEESADVARSRVVEEWTHAHA